MASTSPRARRMPEKLPAMAGEGVLGIMATKRQGPAGTSRVTRPKRTTAPRTARKATITDPFVAVVTDAVTDTAPATVGDPAPAAVGDPAPAAVGDTAPAAVGDTAPAAVTVPPAAILPPPTERVIPRHPWFGEPPARRLAKFLDAWKRRVEQRIAARLPPWVARLVARYGPASMQQRKPVE